MRLFLARGGRHTFWHISERDWKDHDNQAICGTQLAQLQDERMVLSDSELNMEIRETSVGLCPRCREIHASDTA